MGQSVRPRPPFFELPLRAGRELYEAPRPVRLVEGAVAAEANVVMALSSQARNRRGAPAQRRSRSDAHVEVKTSGAACAFTVVAVFFLAGWHGCTKVLGIAPAASRHGAAVGGAGFGAGGVQTRSARSWSATAPFDGLHNAQFHT